MQSSGNFQSIKVALQTAFKPFKRIAPEGRAIRPPTGGQGGVVVPSKKSPAALSGAFFPSQAMPFLTSGKLVNSSTVSFLFDNVLSCIYAVAETTTKSKSRVELVRP